MGGLILILLGLLLRSICIRQLNGNFSEFLLYPKSIVSNGMYKYIRHPMYVGSILMILGAYLINPILGVIFISYCVFANRATIEEQIMCQDKKYEEYMKKTGRFLPKIRINYGTLG